VHTRPPATQATNFTGVLTFTCATRFFYSFARDGGFPYSKKLAYVEPRTGIPVNCVLLMLVSVIALSTAILTENWFSKINAVCSTISNGFLFTYGVPPILRLLNSGSFAPHENFNLGRFSKPCAIIGAGYAFFSVATIALPSFMPATEASLNYAPVALGAVIMFAVVTFPFVGPMFNTYKGPALAHLEEETVWKGNLAYSAAPPPDPATRGMEDTVHGSS
jgi:amino acid transporter